jgi:hypothetical protein
MAFCDPSECIVGVSPTDCGSGLLIRVARFPGNCPALRPIRATGCREQAAPISREFEYAELYGEPASTLTPRTVLGCFCVSRLHGSD